MTLRLAFVRIKPNTDYIQACSTNGIETSASTPPHCLLHSLWFVLECVSKCWLCVSRFCPARLLPIDSRWDLSIKHPEPRSPPNPRVIQSPAPYTHIRVCIHTHLTCHPSIPPSGPLLIPFHPASSPRAVQHQGQDDVRAGLISDRFTIKLKLLFNSSGHSVLFDLAPWERMSYSWLGESAGAGMVGTRFITQPPNV